MSAQARQIGGRASLVGTARTRAGGIAAAQAVGGHILLEQAPDARSKGHGCKDVPFGGLGIMDAHRVVLERLDQR